MKVSPVQSAYFSPKIQKQAKSQQAFFGNDVFKTSKSDTASTINHQAAFFREINTDKFVQDYIRQNFSDKPKVHIVSGACGDGEEAYSYACMLDDIKNFHITGFDTSPKAIQKADNATFSIKRYSSQNKTKSRLTSEGFLLDKNNNIGEYSKKAKEKFHEYFYPLSKKTKNNNR